jgi:TrpR-related protein YerC/YecD
MPNWKTTDSQQLFEMILELDSLEEAQNFFRDLLTEQEIIEFANRWKVACMLSEGVSYTDIEKETGMSSTTIARISKWLNKGMNGYKTQIEKLHHTSPPTESGVF